MIDRITSLWKSHGTKILGFTQVTVGVLAASAGVFDERTLQVLVMCSGLLTAWRGFVNSAAKA